MSVRVSGSKRGVVAVSASNISGMSPVGRKNVELNSGVLFTNPRAKPIDPAKGQTCLLGKGSRAVVQLNTFLPSKLAVGKRLGNDPYEDPSPWLTLMAGDLPRAEQHEVTGLWDMPMGILVNEYEGEQELKYVFSWYFEGRSAMYPYGHRYQRLFDGAPAVAEHFMDEFERLLSSTKAWHDGLLSLTAKKGFPDWFGDLIVNSAYTLSSITWLDDAGRFCMYEAPQSCPCMGTIAALCHEGGSLPVLAYYPELERSFIEMLAGYMREDGYVPHDLGVNSMDDPSSGYEFSGWTVSGG